MPFLSELDYSPIRGKRLWKLDDDLRFLTKKNDKVLIVKKGFISDQASVPRVFWSFFPKDGRYRDAAWLHDAGYAGKIREVYLDHGLLKDKPLAPSRKEVDKLFLEALRDPKLGVGRISRTMLYQAVRLFGGIVWRKGTERRGYK